MGALNTCPSGHLIIAHSSGPSVDSAVNRFRTSAGSPHLEVPRSSSQAGQSRKVIGISME